MALPRVVHMPPFVAKPTIISAEEIEQFEGNNIVAIWAANGAPISVPRDPYEVWIDADGNESCLKVSTHPDAFNQNEAYGNAERRRARLAGWKTLESFVTDGRDEWTVAIKGACPEDEAKIAEFKAAGRVRAEARSSRIKVADITKSQGAQFGEAAGASLQAMMRNLGRNVAEEIAQQMRQEQAAADEHAATAKVRKA